MCWLLKFGLERISLCLYEIVCLLMKCELIYKSIDFFLSTGLIESAQDLFKSVKDLTEKKWNSFQIYDIHSIHAVILAGLHLLAPKSQDLDVSCLKNIHPGHPHHQTHHGYHHRHSIYHRRWLSCHWHGFQSPNWYWFIKNNWIPYCPMRRSSELQSSSCSRYWIVKEMKDHDCWVLCI